MPITKDIKGTILSEVVDSAVISIVRKATEVQLALEEYIDSQVGRMSTEAIKEAVFEGGTTVASNAIKTFQSFISKLVHGTINDSWGQGTAEFQRTERPLETEYTWVNESAKPCPDCAGRGGEKRPYSEWELVGLPRSGFSVCNKSCKCTLDSGEVIEARDYKK